MHLLVIEDDPRLSRLLKRLLEEDRHVVEVATDGRSGLEIAEDAPGIECVVLDIGLPDFSGLEVARRLRAGGSGVQILMLTARDTVGDRVTGLVTVDPEPAEIQGDPARLRQLVMILVDNAIRHAPDGGHVSATVRVDGPSATLVVDDDGPGIAQDDQPRVFDRFYRAAGAPGGGTGLGLAIAAWIVDRHGGRIEAANGPSGGARFTVRLPIASTAGAVAPA
ncbi:MAG: hybrid sensor histidine kinase/response regulator [Candidatus Limnocylindrales bacterium]